MSRRQPGALPFLYETVLGRMLLQVLTARWISKAAGAFCDSPLSKPLIGPFVKRNGIDLSEYQDAAYACFNDFFTRKIKSACRPIGLQDDALISPCDGLLSAYQLERGTVFPAKQSHYTVSSLLKDPALASEFEDGCLLVFRLCVDHYHRYCYVDSGTKGENIFIPGKLHTVRPVALENRAVFCENCREYTVLETDHFGKVIQCEIGAMLVGKIHNHDGKCRYHKGQEKGMFLYGGSTVVLLLKKDAAVIPSIYFENTDRNVETPIKIGQIIGHKP